jgi:hypothetical protein
MQIHKVTKCTFNFATGEKTERELKGEELKEWINEHITKDKTEYDPDGSHASDTRQSR